MNEPVDRTRQFSGLAGTAASTVVGPQAAYDFDGTLPLSI